MLNLLVNLIVTLQHSIPYVPIALGLAVFAVYLFRTDEQVDRGDLAGVILRWATVVVSTLLVLALFHMFLGRHYEFTYVFENSGEDLHRIYRFSAVWAGQAGTFLLWYWLTALVLVIMRRPGAFARGAYMLLGLSLVIIGIFLVKSNPFQLMDLKMLPPDWLGPNGLPRDGSGLNPILRNPWMAIHPPLIFIGYGLAAAPFALAGAGVMRGDFGGWAERARAWSTAAWAFLGAGIFCGSYWAYIILGWGGYWGWDPVENASLFPWIALGALSHGLVIQGRGKRFAFWNVFLAMLGLFMVFMTTFLTRSGVMSEFSVHSFQASDLYHPILYSYMGFTVFCVGILVMAALKLKAQRTEPLKAPPLGATLLTWTVLLMIMCLGFVLLGTIFPLLSKLEFLGSLPLLGRVFKGTSAVQQAYYNKTSYFVMVFVGALLVWCPFAFVKAAKSLKQPVRFAFAGIGALAGILIILVAAHDAHPGAPAFFYFLLAAVGGAVIGANLANSLHFYTLRRWNVAGYLIHLGVGLAVWGILASSAGEIKEDITLALNQPHKGALATYTLTQVRDNTAGDGVLAYVDVNYRSRAFRTVINFSFSERGMKTDPAIMSYGAGDIYLAPKQIDFPQEQSNTVTVGMEGFTRLGSYEIKVSGFNTDKMQELGLVTVIFEVQQAGQTYTLQLPYSVRGGSQESSLPDGTTVSVAEIIRETQSVVLNVNAPAGHFQGEAPGGGAMPAPTDGTAVGRTTPVPAGDWQLVLAGWDTSTMQQNAIQILITATRGQETKSISVPFTATAKPADQKPVTLDDGTVLRAVRISVDPNNHDSEFAVLDIQSVKSNPPSPSESQAAAPRDPAAPAADPGTAGTPDPSAPSQETLPQEPPPTVTVTVGPGRTASIPEGTLSYEGWEAGDSGNDIINLKVSGEGSDDVPLSIGFDPKGKLPARSLNLFFSDGIMWSVQAFDPDTQTVTLSIGPSPADMAAPDSAAAAAAPAQTDLLVHFTALRKPFIAFLWMGMLLITLGALAAAFTRKSGAEASGSK